MNKFLKRKIVPILISFVFLIFSSFFLEFEKGEDLLVYFIDVGQGDSAFLDLPNGIQVLIDAGKNESVIKELEKIMPFWDRSIDILILSHGDLDHIGGFFEILETYSVDQILRAQTKSDSNYLEELLKNAKDLGIIIQELKTGDKIILDQTNNIYIEIYSPKSENLEDSNENSLVFELIHKENEFLFMGDATTQTELNLLKNFGKQMNSDVLKVGHHGSKSSTSQLFLDYVTPDYSILSYGENSYGHPNAEVLQKLEHSGGLIFKTKDRGTIVARSNGQDIEINYQNYLFNKSSLFQSFVSSVFVDGLNSSS